MSKTVYIRHAKKEYINGDSPTFKHDPGITFEGVDHCKKISNMLVNRYGVPDEIICSPYRRARETAIAMSTSLKKPVP